MTWEQYDYYEIVHNRGRWDVYGWGHRPIRRTLIADFESYNDAQNAYPEATGQDIQEEFDDMFI